MKVLRPQPGPWVASEMLMDKKSWASLNDGKNPVNIVMAGGDGFTTDVVAAVWCGDDFDEGKTASQIAASPDMLRALRECLPILEGLHTLEHLSGRFVLLDNVRDAIAKAEGGSR